MSQQREQLEGARSNINATLDIARQAGMILSDM
jgi:hypothetical protein